MSWVIIPAAGKGTRFGAEQPKQYLKLNDHTVIEHSLRAVLSHPDITGAMVALAADDHDWPGWRDVLGKPIFTCLGGTERMHSVFAALQALPATISEDQWVLVHDAARPCLNAVDLSRLLVMGRAHSVGALLASPLRDTLKIADDKHQTIKTPPRDKLWRALTPQLFRRGSLTRALNAAIRAGISVTDEAMAMERLNLKPLLIEGSEENIKITTPADLAYAEFILSRRAKQD
jgi:2-C-methyl-D-erythritol 4-phosphate cytidylyltransferase